MNIIKNNSRPTRDTDRKWSRADYKFICPGCGSELEYSLHDIDYDDRGNAYVTCPCCDHRCQVEDKELTADNFVFPNDFYEFARNSSITDDRIAAYINEGIAWLRTHLEDDNWSVDTGGTTITVDRYDGDEEFNVKVCCGFYEGNLTYNESDKEKFIPDGEGNGRAVRYCLAQNYKG